MSGVVSELREQLAAGLDAGNWEACADAAFRLMHASSPEASRQVAVRALERAWAAFAPARPELGWPREVLEAPGTWAGRALPDWPEPAHPGEAELAAGLDFLAAGSAAATDRGRVAAALASALVQATEAEPTRAWAEHDPEAFAAWSGLEDLGEDDDALALLAGRTVLDDEAAEDLRRAAWAAAATDLAALDVIEPDPSVEADLERWVEHGRLPIVD